MPDLKFVLCCLVALFSVGCGSKAKESSPRLFDSGGAGGAGGDGGAAGASGVCEGVSCPEPLVCTGSQGSAECACPVGESCASLDECAGKPCDINASCVDLEAGFRCACKSGYFGNGFKCSLDELCDGIDCPGMNQVCRSDGTSATCECRDGFVSGNGLDCYDLNECLDASACGAGAECINQPGSFRCECGAGFETDSTGSGCKDRDECESGENGCDEAFGICVNSVGGYSCHCAAGSFGNGYFCKPTSDCSSNPCKNGGHCLETLDGFACACPLGATDATCADTTSCSLTTILDDSVAPIIVDPVLRKALHMITAIPLEAPVRVSDLSGHVDLSVFSEGVVSLDGLECWPTVETISIVNNEVVDVAPLEHLHALTDVNLSCNSVSDVSALSDHVALESLRLSRDASCSNVGSKLGSPAPLASLRGLRLLELNGQGLSQLSFLAALRTLRELDLSNNELAAVGALGALVDLRGLSVSGNHIAAPSGIQSLPGLRRVNLAKNGISEVGPIGSLTQVQRLNLSGNSLESAAGLNNLSSIKDLNLSNNTLSDASPLASLVGIGNLDLSGNPVSSVSAFVENPDFGKGGVLSVVGAPLECSDELPYLRELESRGTFVKSGCLGQ